MARNLPRVSLQPLQTHDRQSHGLATETDEAEEFPPYRVCPVVVVTRGSSPCAKDRFQGNPTVMLKWSNLRPICN